MEIVTIFDSKGKLNKCEHKRPNKVTRVFQNGVVEIEKRKYTEKINARRIKPYIERNDNTN